MASISKDSAFSGTIEREPEPTTSTRENIPSDAFRKRKAETNDKSKTKRAKTKRNNERNAPELDFTLVSSNYPKRKRTEKQLIIDDELLPDQADDEDYTAHESEQTPSATLAVRTTQNSRSFCDIGVSQASIPYATEYLKEISSTPTSLRLNRNITHLSSV